MTDDRNPFEPMNVKTLSKDDLVVMGYKVHTAQTLIRQAKQIMVQRGYPFYNNKRLGRVPREAVEEIIGFSLDVEMKDSV
jgi:hypothetical protein